MDAILFSANPKRTRIDEAIRHLDKYKEVLWTVGFKIVKHFNFPIFGYVHESGGQVEYRVTIRRIVPFSPRHYERPRLKPERWRREWKNDLNGSRSRPHEYSFVISEIVPCRYRAVKFKKADGTSVKAPPQSYVRVISKD